MERREELLLAPACAAGSCSDVGDGPSRTVWSSPAEASHLPSGENAIVLTQPLWPSRRCGSPRRSARCGRRRRVRCLRGASRSDRGRGRHLRPPRRRPTGTAAEPGRSRRGRTGGFRTRALRFARRSEPDSPAPAHGEAVVDSRRQDLSRPGAQVEKHQPDALDGRQDPVVPHERNAMEPALPLVIGIRDGLQRLCGAGLEVPDTEPLLLRRAHAGSRGHPPPVG